MRKGETHLVGSEAGPGLRAAAEKALWGTGSLSPSFSPSLPPTEPPQFFEGRMFSCPQFEKLLAKSLCGIWPGVQS